MAVHRAIGSGSGIRFPAVFVLTAAIATACSPLASLTPSADGATLAPSSQAPFALTVYDLDGPEVDVRINGKVIGHVACQVTSGTFRLEVAEAAAPPLPWSIELVRADSSIVATFRETGSGGARTIYLRASGTYEDATGAPIGPPPAATCRP